MSFKRLNPWIIFVFALFLSATLLLFKTPDWNFLNWWVGVVYSTDLDTTKLAELLVGIGAAILVYLSFKAQRDAIKLQEKLLGQQNDIIAYNSFEQRFNSMLSKLESNRKIQKESIGPIHARCEGKEFVLLNKFWYFMFFMDKPDLTREQRVEMANNSILDFNHTHGYLLAIYEIFELLSNDKIGVKEEDRNSKRDYFLETMEKSELIFIFNNSKFLSRDGNLNKKLSIMIFENIKLENYINLKEFYVKDFFYFADEDLPRETTIYENFRQEFEYQKNKL